MSGLGLASILGIVFVTLKLTHLIAWPWIWVLSPFWIGLVAFLLLVFAASFSQD
jgi:hypothetical protein